MQDPTPVIDLPDEAATARLAEHLGRYVQPGDTILLDGPVGAGKTFLARALIQSLLDVPEDVPSPTFTLVQTYETQAGPLWHADLYRVTSTGELEELGLGDALENCICLIEWPDRLGQDRPLDAITIALTHTATGRNASFAWTDPKWDDRVAGVLSHA